MSLSELDNPSTLRKVLLTKTDAHVASGEPAAWLAAMAASNWPRVSSCLCVMSAVGMKGVSYTQRCSKSQARFRRGLDSVEEDSPSGNMATLSFLLRFFG